MRKKEREELIYTLAYEYAKSGEYKNYFSIEIKLRSEGYIEARAILDNEHIRKELDELCKQAQESKNE